MKKTIIFSFLLLFNIGFSQTVKICTGHFLEDMPANSYIKDIDGEFDVYIGTWVWTNGNETVTFKLQKVTHQLFAESGSYLDYMIGDYKYVVNNITIVNSIDQTLDLLPEQHPMFASCPESQSKIDFIFKDIIIQKDFCRAIFEFLPNSTTQMLLIQKNPETIGSIGAVSPYNYNFTIPNNIVLTKQ